jgi:hypothetical protein
LRSSYGPYGLRSLRRGGGGGTRDEGLVIYGEGRRTLRSSYVLNGSYGLRSLRRGGAGGTRDEIHRDHRDDLDFDV